MAIRLVVGLGNPGKEYERTRHNAGFWLVERFATSNGIALRKDAKFQALVGRIDPAGAWLLLPQSFMNRSGSAVQMLAGFFKIKPEEILVVHDELDFQPGDVRRASKYDSSPRIAPVTRLMPAARTCLASVFRPAVESVGSPWPTSSRLPRQVGPSSSPRPTTSVSKRNSGLSETRAA